MEVLVAHLLNFLAAGDGELSHECQFDLFVAELDVEQSAELCLEVDLRKHKTSLALVVFVAGVLDPLQNVENREDAKVILQDHLLLVDFHHSFEIDAVMEEFHQGFNIWHVSSLKTNVLPDDTFIITQCW